MRLNKNTARRAAAAAALLTMTAAMSVGAFAADDTVVAGYLPPQAESVMTQGDIALHSDVPVGEVDPNYGGYASPVENPIHCRFSYWQNVPYYWMSCRLPLSSNP